MRTGGRVRTAPRAVPARAPGGEPRLLPARAWISSTITVRTVASMRRPAVGGEQDVERLGRGDQDVRRPLAHRPRSPGGVSPVRTWARMRRLGQAVAARARRGCPPAAPRRLRLNVVGQRLQRRDVQHPGLVGQLAGQPLAHQLVDGRQERGQRLAGAGGRRNQGVACPRDRRPGLHLHGRGAAEGLANQRATVGWKRASGMGRCCADFDLVDSVRQPRVSTRTYLDQDV